MSDQENRRPTYSIQRRNRPPPRMRHHNPGTRYRPGPSQIRMLSSITVMPPRRVRMPLSGLASRPTLVRETPSTTRWSADPRQSIWPPRFQPQIPWRTPVNCDLPPPEPVRRRAMALNPVPTVDYRYGFDIFPGEAYGPVPLYINRDLPWELRPYEPAIPRRIHFFRDDVNDPRNHDFRVELVRQNFEDPPNDTPTQPQTQPPAPTPPPPSQPPAQPPVNETRAPQDNRPSTPPPAPRRRRRCRLLIIG